MGCRQMSVVDQCPTTCLSYMCMPYRLQQRYANDEDTNSLTNTLQIELLFPDRSTASQAT